MLPHAKFPQRGSCANHASLGPGALCAGQPTTLLLLIVPSMLLLLPLLIVPSMLLLLPLLIEPSKVPPAPVALRVPSPVLLLSPPLVIPVPLLLKVHPPLVLLAASDTWGRCCCASGRPRERHGGCRLGKRGGPCRRAGRLLLQRLLLLLLRTRARRTLLGD